MLVIETYQNYSSRRWTEIRYFVTCQIFPECESLSHIIKKILFLSRSLTSVSASAITKRLYSRDKTSKINWRLLGCIMLLSDEDLMEFQSVPLTLGLVWLSIICFGACEYQNVRRLTLSYLEIWLIFSLTVWILYDWPG